MAISTPSRMAAFQFTRPRGARQIRRRARAGGRVSIHAPTGGATGARVRRERTRLRFNSRAHGGRDFDDGRHYFTSSFQFTRPRGARRYSFRRAAIWRVFQFTRPRGARPPAASSHAALTKFQFTRPRGARPRGSRRPLPTRCFNSRAHGGRDLLPLRTDVVTAVSIHAPTGGATFAACNSHPRRSEFQFTRPRGVRRP